METRKPHLLGMLQPLGIRLKRRVSMRGSFRSPSVLIAGVLLALVSVSATAQSEDAAVEGSAPEADALRVLGVTDTPGSAASSVSQATQRSQDGQNTAQRVDAIVSRAEEYLRSTDSAGDAGADSDSGRRGVGEAVDSGKTRTHVIALVGELLMTANRPEEALAWFARGADISGAVRRAEFELSRAGALIQLGRSAEARTAARRARDASPSQYMRIRAITLMAEAYAAEGLAREAQDILRGVELVAGENALSAGTLFRMHTTARVLEDDPTASRIATIIREQYPESPEAMLLAGRGDDRVVQALTPTAVTQGIFATPRASTETESTDTDSQAGGASDDAHKIEAAGAAEEELQTFVQVGSFTDPENADYMRQDMEGLGFSATVAPRDFGEQRYYQVLIPVTPEEDVSTQAAVQDLVVRLKERGYEGFLVRR